MASIVVDTDVISFQFKGDARARLYEPHLAGRLWVISFMTLAELRWWAVHRRWGQSRRRQLAEHLRQVQVYFADPDLCDGWADVMERASRKGRPIEVADAWIAATALAIDVPLVTHKCEGLRWRGSAHGSLGTWTMIEIGRGIGSPGSICTIYLTTPPTT